MEGGLKLQERRDGDLSVVSPIGEVDMQTMKPLRELLRRIPDEGVRYVILDMSQVSFLDSAGMSLLFSLKKRMMDEHGECYVVTTGKGFVERALATIDLGRVMPHVHNIQEALDDVQQKQAVRLGGALAAVPAPSMTL